MSIEHIRGLCHAHMNRPVEVRMLDGTLHRGIVSRVDGDHLWLTPLGDGGPRGWDGPGVYWWGFGWGWPIALAGIAGITAIAIAGLWW